MKVNACRNSTIEGCDRLINCDLAPPGLLALCLTEIGETCSVPVTPNNFSSFWVEDQLNAHIIHIEPLVP